MNLHYKNGYKFFFRICSTFSSNDWKNALQHLKNNTLLHRSVLSKHCNFQFKQILAKQIEISFIYTSFLIFLLFYLQLDSSASQGHLQRPQGFDSSAYCNSQVFIVCIPVDLNFIANIRAVWDCKLFKHQIQNRLFPADLTVPKGKKKD